MITLKDSLKLAYTKIRTRRIRLFVVLFVSSLLFSGLVAGSLIVSGALKSFATFSDEGFTGRYIVAGSYTDVSSMNGSPNQDPVLIARAEALEKEQEARKKVEAKRLGIEYTPNDTDKAVTQDESGNKYLNIITPIAAQAVAEKEAADPLKIDAARFKQQLGVPAKAYYESRKMSSFGVIDQPSLSLILEGKEEPAGNGPKASFGPGTTRGLDGIKDGWTLMDRGLLTPFLLKDQTLALGSDGSIPIIVSYSAAQQVLKLPTLDAKATNEQKKQRLLDVRNRIAGQKFQICYRNNASHVEVQNATQQQAEIVANKDKKDYQKPDLITAPSTTPCAAPVVQRDVRSAEEKRLVAKKAEFDRIFGKQDAQSAVMNFRIVGISPDREIPTGMSVSDILSSVLSSTIGTGWASPTEVYEAVPAAKDLFRQSAVADIFTPQYTYYAEYDNPEQARQALKQHSCTLAFPGMPQEEDQVPCSRAGRPFMLQPFGSVSLALDEFRDGFRRTQLVVAGVVGLIAAVILMGMIGRIIADARRETAIFRALGASRFAISQVYITYTIFLATLTIFISLLIGFGLAAWTDSQLGPDMSITMALLFNSADLSQKFHFYSFDPYDIGLISAVVIGAAIVGSIIPIAHNVSRNPIKDMREE